MLSHLSDKHITGIWSTLVIGSCFQSCMEDRTDWGMYEASQWLFRVPRQNGADLKLMNSLVFYQNIIEWEKSIYDIISLCTSVNFICHLCDQLILLNRCIDDDILILPAMTMTLVYQDLSQIPDLIYDLSSVWHQTITKTNANLWSFKPVKMHKSNGYLPQNSNIYMFHMNI